MKYRVRIDYHDYIFEDRNEALDFAETAFFRSDKPRDVSIDLIREEVEE